MWVNRESNAARSGSSTVTAVAGGNTPARRASAITTSDDNGVSLARSTRSASSTDTSLSRAAWCNTRRYSFVPTRVPCSSTSRSNARRNRLVGNRSSRYR